MGNIVFPVSSAPGQLPHEGAGRIINGYSVKTEQGAIGPIRWTRSPGLRQLLAINGFSHYRGSIVIGTTLLVVLNQRVFSIQRTPAGAYIIANLGALDGTQPVTIARNNATPIPHIVCVTENGTFNLFVTGPPTPFADADLPSVNSVEGMDGYFIFTTGQGFLWASNLNDPGVATNAFVAAQSKPDGLLRFIAFRGEGFAFGQFSIEVYQDLGLQPFPLQYKQVLIPRGLIGQWAVAGYQDYWANELIWVADDNNVYQLSGYTPKPISNDDVGAAIRDARDRTAIQATVYMDGKYPFVAITSPGEWTWEYNIASGAWNERKSNGRTDWRGRIAIRAFDSWLIGDDTTGKLFEIDPHYHKEDNDALVWELISGANAVFPARVQIPRIDLNFAAALGSAPGAMPIETAPRVMISWSLDGGYRYGTEVQRELGRQGQGGKGVGVNNLGTTKGKGARVRLRVSDPVPVSFMGGTMQQNPLRV